VDVRGVPVEIVDTAGLRETEDAVERIGVERAREAGETADAVLYVFDAAVGWSPEDEAAVAALQGTPVVTIANKIDKLSGRAHTGPGEVQALSGIAPGAGARLADILAETVARDVSTDSSSETLSSARQRDLVERARAAGSDTLAALARGDSPEYAATHLDAALDALADLAGETTPDDVLQQIFATFCIGK
jgi:tRNA modification GTPase